MTEQELLERELEGAKRWVREWNNIPTEAIHQLSRVEEVQRLTSDEPTDSHLPMWGTMFSFGDQLDDGWVEDNLASFEECGVMVFDVPSIGYVLGIDGAGYDFYEQHWLPLYRKRGLQWHLHG